MKFKHFALLVTVIAVMAGCKKDAIPEKTAQTANLAESATPKKDTIYLVKQMVTNQLLGPSPVTQTENFKYNANRQLTKHTVTYKSASSNFTLNYAITYNNGKVSEVNKTGTKHYPWKKLLYTYAGYTCKIVYVYPESRDSITIYLGKDTLAKKVQGNFAYYLLDYDGKRNITKRTQYDNGKPANPTGTTVYTYDNKRSPFWSLRDNVYILTQAFNDLNTHNNNRVSNNLFELYNHTYNTAGYPTQTVVVHSSVAIRKIDYTYTKVAVN
ncbi:MAG: hypothetical protein EOP47_22670 [Sphingobacteriaceae bacterium]|nr:MAG: hypothetical protein EOP47_22670 [Sphingobacteriaceae bacterium]